MNPFFLIPHFFLGVALATEPSLPQYCENQLKSFPGPSDAVLLKKACQKVEALPSCHSVERKPIFHFDRTGTSASAQKILVFSLIHGDETPAGSVGRFWMERLEKIEPRNSWRVIPILNPDGVRLKTRTNANRIDLNRNFPTSDWEKSAAEDWKKNTRSNPRRFPGKVAGSEPEVQCALDEIKDFAPQFIVSIHTPLKVLDYDGPAVNPPKFDYLPWKNLGTFPGSLGRYMWKERHVPVLTMEMHEDMPQDPKPFVQLQDVIGLLVSLDLNEGASPSQKPH